MNKTNLLLSVFILSAVLFFACSSSSSPTNCNCENNNSSGVENSGSSSSNGGVQNSSNSINSSSSVSYVGDQDIIRKNIRLSLDSSYADIDGAITIYKKADVKNNILGKIDLIAHCGDDSGYCEHNSIYSPYVLDLFWNRNNYLGSYVFFLAISNAQTAKLETAHKYSEIIETWNEIVVTWNNTDVDDLLEEVPIVIGKAFAFSTSDRKFRIAIIKTSNDQSVGLEIIESP